jgi:hypothetical protein
MVTHVIRGQPFYILGEGVVLNLTGCHRFSFSNHQIKTFTFMRTLAFIPSKIITSNKQIIKKNGILEIFVKLFTISRESIVH